jgi:DNA-3-methyladenine glycosylase II
MDAQSSARAQRIERPRLAFMTVHLNTQDDLDALLRILVAQDPRLKPVIEMTGHAPLRRRAPGFAGLAATICGQQLSTFAAAAIWARMVAAYDEVHHEHIRAARADRLRRFGLSVAKIKTLKVIAHEIAEGRLDLAKLADAPADEAHDTLTALHGIGPWTADIYLLACLGHADAWPAGDLALQEASRLAFALPARPNAKEMIPLAEPWRPWRGVAARLLWAYYRAVKGREAAPIQPTNVSGDKDGGRARRSAA